MASIPETRLDSFVSELPLATKIGQLFVSVHLGTPETTDHLDWSFPAPMAQTAIDDDL